MLALVNPHYWFIASWWMLNHAGFSMKAGVPTPRLFPINPEEFQMNIWIFPAFLIFVVFVLVSVPSAIAIYRYWFGGGKLLSDRLPPKYSRSYVQPINRKDNPMPTISQPSRVEQTRSVEQSLNEYQPLPITYRKKGHLHLHTSTIVHTPNQHTVTIPRQINCRS